MNNKYGIKNIYSGYMNPKIDNYPNNQGFTQILNHIFKNANWVESKFDDRLALIDLYGLAQFKDGYVIKKGKTIILKPGLICV